MEREEITINKSIFDALRELSPTDAWTVFSAIMDYAFNGKQPSTDEMSMELIAIFRIAKPRIDDECEKYDKAKRINEIRAENGRKGGAPKGSHNNPNGRRGKQKDL